MNYLCIDLNRELPPVLALGAEQKNTVCLTRANQAFVSAPIGALNSPSAIEKFHQTVDSLQQELAVSPVAVAHDLHPDFYATRFAASLEIPAIGVQHHHAHIASVMAEQRVSGAVIGLALDGYGYGPTGEAWGGELLWLEGANMLRIGGLLPLPQPGGDKAALQPWRMALAVLSRLGRDNEVERRYGDRLHAGDIALLVRRGVHTPLSSSCGRLFDAAASLLGVCHENRLGMTSAAVQLQCLVRHPRVYAQGWRIVDGQLDLLPLFEFLLQCDARTGADYFHGTMIAALTDWVVQACSEYTVRKVLLAGGCYHNPFLRGGLFAGLAAEGLRVVLPARLSVDDSAISLGQAWVAAQHLAASVNGYQTGAGAPIGVTL